ncbi:MAG: response regulator [Candidatus Kapabacteria bacterium]|nr:response regulator [Ignavibacteriota bacterium]MCW5884670.1 response regulator [Candidatus Kapabacteria bacterium]
MNAPKILIVDDQDINLILIKKNLKELELDIIAATSGYEAIEILKSVSDIELILMDIHMSGLNGFETVKIIKENVQLADIPVIFVTAYYDQADYIKQGYNLGAYDYIIKPFDKNTLIGKVRLYLSLVREQKINKVQSAKLKDMNRSLNILNECNTALVYAESENEIFNAFTSIIVDKAGYPLVWIGKLIDSEENKVKIKLISYTSKEPIGTSTLSNSLSEPFECICINSSVADKDNLSISECMKKCDISKNFRKYSNHRILTMRFGKHHFSQFVINIYVPDDNILSENEMELLNSISQSLVYGQSALSDKFDRKKYQQELFREKEELSTTLNSITDGVIFFQPNGKIMYFNNAATEILEIKPDSFKELLIFDLFEVEGESGLFNPIDMIQNSDTGDIKFQINILSKSGKKLILSGKMAEIKSNDKYLSGITMFFQDITEQTRLSNELSLAQKMESVGRLASGIAHEINTPLQFIGDNNYFLNDASESLTKYLNHVDNELKKLKTTDICKVLISNIQEIKNDLNIEFLLSEIKNAVKSNLDGIQRVSKIVMAMKNFAHPSEKQKILSDINNAIETTAVISNNEWKYDCDLVLELEPELPHIYAVFDEINQVLLNMIINSVHAIQEKEKSLETGKKGRISIRTSSDEDFVKIEITDSGTGISKENITKIFDPFFTTKPVGKGTGQGLPIVHDIIVNKHKGRLSVESEFGEFTKFTLQLPR